DRVHQLYSERIVPDRVRFDVEVAELRSIQTGWVEGAVGRTDRVGADSIAVVGIQSHPGPARGRLVGHHQPAAHQVALALGGVERRGESRLGRWSLSSRWGRGRSCGWMGSRRDRSDN